ncbi:hypothetical protein ABH19_06645 [Leptospirillum sp. Group II 'CF-1']|nr:hypothetical protein ABH19_06645 [Leptospirillum sp. Group II 'CF-1']
MRKVEIENFKYFIVGFGALPIGMVYGFLRAYYKLTNTLFLFLSIALAFLCGHYLWIFAKKYFLKNKTLSSPISDPHSMHFKQTKETANFTKSLLEGVLTEKYGSRQQYNDLLMQRLNEFTTTSPDKLQTHSLSIGLAFLLAPEIFKAINATDDIVFKATDKPESRNSTILSVANTTLQYPKFESVAR